MRVGGSARVLPFHEADGLLDGVVADVSASYRTAIRRTAESGAG